MDGRSGSASAQAVSDLTVVIRVHDSYAVCDSHDAHEPAGPVARSRRAATHRTRRLKPTLTRRGFCGAPISSWVFV